MHIASVLPALPAAVSTRCCQPPPVLSLPPTGTAFSLPFPCHPHSCACSFTHALLQADPGSEAPPGRGGAGCVAIGRQRILVYGGADRTPTAFSDWWLLELGESGAHWTRISPVVKLSAK